MIVKQEVFNGKDMVRLGVDGNSGGRLTSQLHFLMLTIGIDR
jgi:hypothetical protein